jgi:hypothetical protein
MKVMNAKIAATTGPNELIMELIGTNVISAK